MKNNVMKNNVMQNNVMKNNVMKNNATKNSLYEYYGEMYGDNKDLSNDTTTEKFIENSYGLNEFENSKPIQENNISILNSNNLGNNYVQSNPSSNYKIFQLISILIIICLLILLYFYRKEIKSNIKYYYDSLFKSSSKQEKEIKQLNKSMKDVMKKRETNQKNRENEKKKNKGGVNQLVQKMKYNKDQISENPGYCYIGEENGQRSCSEIYEGDICMSGEIFQSNELCMNPKLRL